MVQDGRGPILNHCVSVAYETIPNRARTILGKAFTQGLAGGAGDVAGSEGEAAVLGQTLVKNAVPALGLLGFLSNIFFGATSGDNEVNQLFRSATDACLARAGGGLYTMAPSEQDAILSSGQGRQVGVSYTWHHLHPMSSTVQHTQPAGTLVQPTGTPSN
jgi:hypothetical protein